MGVVTKVTILHLALILLLVSGVIILSGGGSETSALETSKGSQQGETFIAADMTGEAKTLKENLTKTSDYLNSKVIVDNESFSVTYFYSSDNFTVNVKGEQFPAKKAAAEEWFIGQGFRGFDLCHLNIGFYSEVSEVYLSLSKSDLVFQGCPVVEATPEDFGQEAAN